MFKMFQSKKGFSMVELIVVIAILGVISAIAIPVVLNTLSDSKVKADIATAQAISGAVNVAIVSANGDNIDGNDIPDTVATTALSDLSDELLAELSKTFPDIASKTLQSDGSEYSITITNATTAPAWTVTFTAGGKDYSVDQSGKASIVS